ncbi:hypothetical protein D3C81_2206190 [compost metagenome]
MEDALGLAEGITEQHAGFVLLGVGLPPLVDLGKDLRLRLPAIDWQAECRLGDEGVATHRLECGAGAIGFDLVVP